jgi:hypothetical protein
MAESNTLTALDNEWVYNKGRSSKEDEDEEEDEEEEDDWNVR